jgi:uncharacterized membrane protein
MSTQLIIAIFENDEAKAEEVMVHLKKLAESKALEVKDAASVTRQEDGKVIVKDISKFIPQRGALYGAITGGLVFLLAGPAAAVVGVAAGALTGAGISKLSHYGVPKNLIKEVEDSLSPGSSGVIAYVEMSWIDQAVAWLEEMGAKVTHETLDEASYDALIGRTER